MTNKIIEEQLKKINDADLSNFNKEENTYYIPKKQTIKIEENNCYILKLKDSTFKNTIVLDNWNGGKMPGFNCYKADIMKKMSGMIKILGVAYDLISKTDLNKFWTGWLDIKDVEVIEKL